MTEDPQLQSRLQAEIKEGFNASAFKGVDGITQPLPKDDKAIGQINMRFATMISNDLVPFPMPKPGYVPKGTMGSYVAFTSMNHKTHTFRNGNEFAEDMQKTLSSHNKTLTGKVATYPPSLGFLTSQTSTATTIGAGEFQPDVMKAFNDGKARERVHEANRLELASTPFTTPDPHVFVSRNALEHGNMLPAAQSMTTAITTKRNPSSKARTGAAVEDADLLKTLEAERRKKSSGKTLTPSVGKSETTNAKNFAACDPAKAVSMNRRIIADPADVAQIRNRTEEEAEFLRNAELRHEQRHAGPYATNSAVEFAGKTPEHPLDQKNHHMTGIFDVTRSGIRTTKPSYHRPRGDVETGESYSASQVVPHQYLPMSANNDLLASVQKKSME